MLCRLEICGAGGVARLGQAMYRLGRPEKGNVISDDIVFYHVFTMG